MSLRMPHLVKNPRSKNCYYRARVPEHVRKAALGHVMILELPAIEQCSSRSVEVTIGREVKFSLGTSDASIAARRKLFVDGHLAERYATISKPPQPLSNQNLSALAGIIYHKFVERFSENPGARANWTALKAFNRAAREGRLLNPPSLRPFQYPNDAEAARQIFGVNLTEGIESLKPTQSVGGLEARFGLLTDWVLELHGLRIDAASRLTLLQRVEQSTTDAAKRLKKAADGDYSPDPAEMRFPVLRLRPSLTIDDLFDRWKKETSPSPNTLSSWGKPLRLFKEHLNGTSLSLVEAVDIVRWKDRLLEHGIKPQTINNTYLAAVSRWFEIGVENRLLPQNPAKGIRVSTGGQLKGARRAYSDGEIEAFVREAASANQEIRWLVWLTIGTGARIGEIAQLWGSSFREINSAWYLHIEPAEDGGRLKNSGSRRIVPIHPTLIAAGLIDYVRSKGSGPLFYKRSSGDATKKHASKGVTNRLSGWIRKKGFTDGDLAPCHSIRHWWKTTAHRCRVDPIDADTFQGHSIRGVAHSYRHIRPEDLMRVVEVMPFPGHNCETWPNAAAARSVLVRRSPGGLCPGTNLPQARCLTSRGGAQPSDWNVSTSRRAATDDDGLAGRR